MEEFQEKVQEAMLANGSYKEVKVYAYANKEDLMDKYVRDRLLQIKMEEPNRTEKAEENYAHHVERLNQLLYSFSHKEPIIVGLFGVDDMSMLDTDETDTRVYHVKDTNLLGRDIREYYEG